MREGIGVDPELFAKTVLGRFTVGRLVFVEDVEPRNVVTLQHSILLLQLTQLVATEVCFDMQLLTYTHQTAYTHYLIVYLARFHNSSSCSHINRHVTRRHTQVSKLPIYIDNSQREQNLQTFLQTFHTWRTHKRKLQHIPHAKRLQLNHYFHRINPRYFRR